MHILDYRTPTNPVHHRVEGLTITADGVHAEVLTSYPALLAEVPRQAGLELRRTFDLPAGTADIAPAAAWLADGPLPGVVVSAADYPMTHRRMDMLAAVKSKRNAVRDGGCLTMAGRVDTDAESRLNIAGAVSMAAIGGAAFSVEWRMSDNSIVTLDAAGMTGVGLAVGAFVAACQSRKNALDAAITAAETLADLDAIDIDAGWPE